MNGAGSYEGASPEKLACLLEGHPDYRVQRRLRPMSSFKGQLARGSSTLSGCALNVKTTGFHHRTHALVELAVQRFRADQDGRISDVGLPFRWTEDAGFDISSGMTAHPVVDGSTLNGRRICDAEATCMLLDADFIVAHNGAFDRPFVERRLPLTAGRPWVCTMHDVDWSSHGFEGRDLSCLLRQMGWFYDPLGADAELNALLHLLDHPSGRDGRTVLAEAVASASRAAWRV